MQGMHGGGARRAFLQPVLSAATSWTAGGGGQDSGEQAGTAGTAAAPCPCHLSPRRATSRTPALHSRSFPAVPAEERVRRKHCWQWCHTKAPSHSRMHSRPGTHAYSEAGRQGEAWQRQGHDAGSCLIPTLPPAAARQARGPRTAPRSAGAPPPRRTDSWLPGKGSQLLRLVGREAGVLPEGGKGRGRQAWQEGVEAAQAKRRPCCGCKHQGTEPVRQASEKACRRPWGTTAKKAGTWRARQAAAAPGCSPVVGVGRPQLLKVESARNKGLELSGAALLRPDRGAAPA
jgi:hypothetical protein